MKDVDEDLDEVEEEPLFSSGSVFAVSFLLVAPPLLPLAFIPGAKHSSTTYLLVATSVGLLVINALIVLVLRRWLRSLRE